jgi:hypothetical protein
MTKSLLAASLALFACGGDPKPEVKAPEPVASTVATTPAPEPTASSTGTTAAVAPPPPREAPAEEAKVLAFERAKDFGKVDKVGKEDGKLSPDGTKDAAFTLKIAGGVDAIFVAQVDKNGDALGTFQADTLTGTQIQPNELAIAKAGKLTMGIGVFEGDKLLNKPDGSVSGVFAHGEHTLTLYVEAATLLKAGKMVRVWVQMPDHTVVAGPILK